LQFCKLFAITLLSFSRPRNFANKIDYSWICFKNIVTNSWQRWLPHFRTRYCSIIRFFLRGSCSCLASAWTFTSPKWGFHRWQGGCPFHILPLGARFEIPRDFWAPPVNSMLSRGWISLETAVILWPPLSGGISLETAVMVQIIVNYHPTKLINIDQFQYILNTLFFFYSLWYPFSVLHLSVAIIEYLRMRFTEFHLEQISTRY